MKADPLERIAAALERIADALDKPLVVDVITPDECVPIWLYGIDDQVQFKHVVGGSIETGV